MTVPTTKTVSLLIIFIPIIHPRITIHLIDHVFLYPSYFCNTLHAKEVIPCYFKVVASRTKHNISVTLYLKPFCKRPCQAINLCISIFHALQALCLATLSISNYLPLYFSFGSNSKLQQSEGTFSSAFI